MNNQQWYAAIEEGTGAQKILVRGELVDGWITNWTAIVKEAASGGATWETRAGSAGYCGTEGEARREATAALGSKEDLDSKEN